ncbi:MAG: hypothetical protein V4692_07640, partial [Bdellovibrionota bacterium]
KSTAASVVYNRLGDIADAKFHEVHKHKGEALICYSVSELKKVPKGSLNHQLIALTLHEFAHLFGFGELDAQSLQRFLLVYGNTFLNTDFVGLDNLDPRWVEETLVDLETHTAANKSDATLCVWSTMMLKATMEYRENVWAATFESPGRIRIVNSIAGPQSNYIVLLTGS